MIDNGMFFHRVVVVTYLARHSPKVPPDTKTHFCIVGIRIVEIASRIFCELTLEFHLVAAFVDEEIGFEED